LLRQAFRQFRESSDIKKAHHTLWFAAPRVVIAMNNGERRGRDLEVLARGVRRFAQHGQLRNDSSRNKREVAIEPQVTLNFYEAKQQSHS
jgi:hypothetical protein